MDIRSLCRILDAAFPPIYQESYDNSGLQLGDPSALARAALLCLDVTEAVIDEAIELGCNLIVAHHPLIFHPIKRITKRTHIERCIHRAIQAEIAIYAAHTSADNALPGINTFLGEKLGLTNIKPLIPLEQQLIKLVVYVPTAYADQVQQALWQAGAGRIGGYDCCSFGVEGHGTFRAGVKSKPFCGAIGSLHREAETSIQVVLPRHLKPTVLATLLAVHPYEEPAYDLIPLDNQWSSQGSGLIGELSQAVSEDQFLSLICQALSIPRLNHSTYRGVNIQKVAICGGAGGSFWRAAAQAGADALLTGEVKYNDYYDAADSLLLIGAGHFETEHTATEVFKAAISREMPTFALHVSKRMCNPVNYYNQPI